MVRALVLLIALSVALDYSKFLFFDRQAIDWIGNYLMFSAVVQSLIWTLVAIVCHRVMLDDPDQPTMLGGLSLGFRQIRYIGYAIVVGLPTFVYMIILVTVIWDYFGFEELSLKDLYLRELISLAIYLPMLCLAARFSLVLPAAAMQERMSFKNAWLETRGNGLRLTAILAAFPVFYSFVFPLLSKYFPLEGYARMEFFRIIKLSIGIFCVAALSRSYHWFMNNDLGLDESPGNAETT